MRTTAVLLSAALVFPAPSGAWARRSSPAAASAAPMGVILALPAASVPSSFEPPLTPSFPALSLPAAAPVAEAAADAAAVVAMPAASAETAAARAVPAAALPAPAASRRAPREESGEVKGLAAGFASLERTADRLSGFTAAPVSLRIAFDGDGVRPGAPSGPSGVRADYLDFLERLGFKPYARRAGSALSSSRDIHPVRREVLDHNRRALRVFDAARELAAAVMEGVAAQGYSEGALAKAADLAGRLAALRPLPAPESLPEEVVAARPLAEWIGETTARRIDRQLAAVTSDLVDTIHGPGSVAEALRDPRGGKAQALAGEAAGLAKLVEEVLLPQYADLELGETRFASRALAASLERYGVLSGRAEVRDLLERALAARGVRLSDLVGDTVAVPERSGGVRRMRVRTGDVLGLRSRTRKASEITAALRPHASLWMKAWRMGVLGSVLGIFITPHGDEPSLTPGQPVRNALRSAVFHLRRWVADQPWFLRGFSHAGIAAVEEADGVRMTWVYESDLNSAEGGLRKVGLADQFLQPHYYVRFGVARMDPERAAAEFLRQARRIGWREDPRPGWPRGISREDWSALIRLAEKDPPAFLAALNGFALRQLDFMFSELGVAYAPDFAEKLYRSYCGLSIWLAYLLGALFDIQPLRDQWHPLARALKRLGYGNAQGLDMRARVIWPASFFVDPKVSRPAIVDLPGPWTGEAEAGRSMPAYFERDPALTEALAGLLSGRRRGLGSDHRRVRAALVHLLELRRGKRERARAAGQDPWRAGVSPAVGYFAAVEELYARRLGEER